MAWIIRTTDTHEEVYYYEGSQQTFGGEWGDPTLYEQVETDDREPETNNSQSIIGDYFSNAESLGTTSTSGTTYTRKLRLITDELPEGYYRLGFSFAWNLSSNDSFLARIRQNNTADVWSQLSTATPSLTIQNPSSGSVYLTLDSGTYTFDLEFATSLPGIFANISQAKFEFWRLY